MGTAEQRTIIQQHGDVDSPAQAPPRSTKCHSRAIKGHVYQLRCGNFYILKDYIVRPTLPVDGFDIIANSLTATAVSPSH